MKLCVLKSDFDVLIESCCFHLLTSVWLFETPWPAHTRPPCLRCLPEFSQTCVHWVSDAIKTSYSLSLPSPLALNLSSIRVFSSLTQLFTSGGQSIAASASVLPMNIRGWFPLGLTGLISLLSKELSRVFSSIVIWTHQFFAAQSSLWSNSHIHTWLLKKL